MQLKMTRAFNACWTLPPTKFFRKRYVHPNLSAICLSPPQLTYSTSGEKVLAPGLNPTQLIKDITAITSAGAGDGDAENFRRIQQLIGGAQPREEQVAGFGGGPVDVGLTAQTFATPLTGIRIGNLGRITAIPASELAQSTADGYGVSEDAIDGTTAAFEYDFGFSDSKYLRSPDFIFPSLTPGFAQSLVLGFTTNWTQ